MSLVIYGWDCGKHLRHINYTRIVKGCSSFFSHQNSWLIKETSVRRNNSCQLSECCAWLIPAQASQQTVCAARDSPRLLVPCSRNTPNRDLRQRENYAAHPMHKHERTGTSSAQRKTISTGQSPKMSDGIDTVCVGPLSDASLSSITVQPSLRNMTTVKTQHCLCCNI